MQELVFTPSDFVAVLNQTLEYAYPSVIIEGELSNFRVSKNRWVYFDLKDDQASVRFFGSVYQLPGPLEDGLSVRVVGAPRLHARFGFSVTFQSILPVGKGSLKKAADLLFKKLEAEGLFAPERKRLLPLLPQNIGLITAEGSAAAADFIKILNERWGGMQVSLADVYVQGDQAPLQLANAIEHMNELSPVPEVLVITRGGGSADDLAAFSDERVVRAVASSRVPTLVAVGHEVDISLAELAADQRASTPSNAAQLLVPDKKSELAALQNSKNNLIKEIENLVKDRVADLDVYRSSLKNSLSNIFSRKLERLHAAKRLLKIFDPQAALQRGYALISKGDKHIQAVSQLLVGDQLNVRLSDGIILAAVKKIITSDAQKKP